MTIDNKIWDEKVQFDVNKEAARISTLSSDILTVEDWPQIIEQPKFEFFPLEKALGKQTKNEK